MSTLHVIKVPDVGEGVAEVELVAWHVQFGDTVAEDQVLADVMTDKASVEIPSPVAGRVVALGGEVGQTLAVGSELMRIETGTVAVTAVAAAPVARPAPAASPAVSPAPEPAAAPTPAPTAPARPLPATAAGAARPIASPAVRRRAWELGIDLGAVPATGPAGRTVQADLDAWLAAHPRTSAPAAVPTAAVTPAAAAPAGQERHDQQVIPVIGLRRRIAMRLQDAKRRIPHFSYVEELDVTELEALRATLNARWKAERGHLTLLPLLMRALVLALREVPQCNALFDDEAGVVTRHGAVHIGVATQTPHGLMVPVLRHAEARDLWAMAAEVARLADDARAGRATRAELSGSTITVSSLGALGGIVSTPILNAPEVAIVGVNRIVERPALRDGMVVARKTMNLSSSFDHRVVDGADGARLIQAVRARVESPALLFVD